MLVSWILPLAIVAVFAALLAAPLVEALLPTVRRRRFVCPWAAADVTVDFVQRAPFCVMDPPDVASCSAFPEGQEPACSKGCLRSLDLS